MGAFERKMRRARKMASYGHIGGREQAKRDVWEAGAKAMRDAEKSMGRALRAYSRMLAKFYFIHALVKTFGFDAGEAVRFSSLADQRRNAIEEGCVSEQEIVEREIRGSAFEDSPALGWVEYSPERLSQAEYMEALGGVPESLKGARKRAVEMWGANEACKEMGIMEAACISVLNRFFGWGRDDCSKLVGECRKLRRSSEEEVMAMMRSTGESLGHFPEERAKMFYGARNVWRLALLKDRR